VEITDTTCRNVGAAAPSYEVSIEATITNIGTATVTQPIWVRAETPCENDNDIILTHLDPGDTATADFVIQCGPNDYGCHDVTVTVDYTRFISECLETNNEDTATFCCR
jgi:hypothetical protein